MPPLISMFQVKIRLVFFFLVRNNSARFLSEDRHSKLPVVYDLECSRGELECKAG